jgi:hypothetical protein
MAKPSKREILLSRRLAAKGPVAPPDEAFRKAYPQLFDFLTRPLVVGGRVLEMPRLTLSVGDADWALTLSDALLCQSLTARGSTQEEALGVLEQLLVNDSTRWSLWKGKEPRLPKVPEKKKGKPLDNGT